MHLYEIFKQNITKAIAVILYICKETKEDNLNVQTLFEILYYADKKHLALYGRTILKDYYVSKDNGAAPLYLNNYLNQLKKKDIHSEVFPFFDIVPPFNLIPKEDPDMDELSVSDKECIDYSINEYKENKEQWKNITKDYPWAHPDKYGFISTSEMARSLGASESIIEYIEYHSFYNTDIL